MVRSPEPPPGALVLRTYGELDQFVTAFAEGLLNLLVIIGRPGVQKSQAVKAAVGRRACWIDGSATAFGLYRQLYRHRDRPVVIDDVDGLYADRAAGRCEYATSENWLRRAVWTGFAGPSQTWSELPPERSGFSGTG